jgi:hypothetical protein
MVSILASTAVDHGFRALPTYGCPNEIAAQTYPKLLGLLDQLLGFSASSMATQCFSG